MFKYEIKKYQTIVLITERDQKDTKREIHYGQEEEDRKQK
jgi:hypothetical protein